MAKNFILFALIGTVVYSCTLSTEQEMNLNRDVGQFIQVKNEGDALSFLNYMHPSIVRHYKDTGDSTFIEKFDITTSKNNPYPAEEFTVLWDQGYIKKVIKKEDLIEAKIEISLVEFSLTNGRHSIDSTLIYYAISNVNSSNWLFASAEDYAKLLHKDQQLFQ